MRGNQIILLSFAVIAIGLFVLPNTMSMFVGQHYWYSVRTADAQYRLCARCHYAEVGEWEANTGAHSAYRDYYRDHGGDPGCFCHQINTTRLNTWNITDIDSKNYTFFNQSGTINGSDPTSWGAGWRNTTTPHAATTIYCVDCHVNATTQLDNPYEAHRQFYNQSRDDDPDTIKTNNTPCMACHTMVGLNVTMNRTYGGLSINAIHNTNYSWTITIGINDTRTSDSNWTPPYNP